ncbi:hypothetical protein EfmJHP38_26790 [Enterococcus faecium]|nr:hypothetical protein EfmJHP38_26790 [Enterococcus faecium]
MRKRPTAIRRNDTLEDIISRCRDKAENNLFSILLCSLTDIQIEKLESLFQIYEETKITKLAWLKDIPGKANPESFMSITGYYY